jgi:hypothetical protein
VIAGITPFQFIPNLLYCGLLRLRAAAKSDNIGARRLCLQRWSKKGRTDSETVPSGASLGTGSLADPIRNWSLTRCLATPAASNAQFPHSMVERSRGLGWEWY